MIETTLQLIQFLFATINCPMVLNTYFRDGLSVPAGLVCSAPTGVFTSAASQFLLSVCEISKLRRQENVLKLGFLNDTWRVSHNFMD